MGIFLFVFQIRNKIFELVKNENRFQSFLMKYEINLPFFVIKSRKISIYDFLIS